MAFWRIGHGFSTISEVEKILDRPDKTLEELLEEPDLLQELHAPNTKLIEYLRSPEIMVQMVRIIADLNHTLEDKPGDGGGDQEQEPGSGTPPPRSRKDEDSGNEKKRNEMEIDSDEDDKNITNIKKQIRLLNPDSNGEDNNSNNNNEDDDDDDDDEALHNQQSYSSDNEEDQQQLQRHAQIVSEILSADVWSLTESLMESPELIDELWQILDYPTPLSISYASYFTKISEHLLDKKTDDMLDFIKNQLNFVSRFMKHIDNPPLMDFLLKVISSDKSENPTGIIDFLQQQELISSLIAFLGPDVPSSVQSAAGDFLKAFVTISANSNTDTNTIGPNELSRELVSEKCVSELVRLMLHGGTGLATGVGVVIEIIRKNNSDYDFIPVMCTTLDSHPPGPRDPIYLGHLVTIFADNIPKFQEMLSREHNEELQTPFGRIQPLGFERFKICELFAELLHCSNMALLNDNAGASTVAARDKERERVKQVIAKAKNGMSEEDEEEEDDSYDEQDKSKVNSNDDEEIADAPTTPGKTIETGIENLDLQKRINSDNDNDSNNNNNNNNDDNENSNNDEEETSHNEDDQDSINKRSEETLRESPVPGDKLKIALADNNCAPTILQMFFQFPWNNFLHNVVYDIIQQILNGPMKEGFNRFLAIDLFGKGKLTEEICEGHAKCEEYEAQTKTRLGYMGHLTLISEEVVKFTAMFPPESISSVISEAVTRQDWITYVTHTLVKTREQYNAILGGQRPEDADIHTNPDAILLPDHEMDAEEEDGDIGTEFGEELQGGEQHYNNNNNRLGGGQMRLHDDEDDEDEYDDEDGGFVGGDSGGQFARYMTSEMTGSGHFESSDEEDDEDDWVTENRDDIGTISVTEDDDNEDGSTTNQEKNAITTNPTE